MATDALGWADKEESKYEENYFELCEKQKRDFLSWMEEEKK